MAKLKIQLIEDWDTYYFTKSGTSTSQVEKNTLVNDVHSVTAKNEKFQLDDFYRERLAILKKTESTIINNISLFIEGLQEEGHSIPDELIFNLLHQNDQWYITEKNSQIVFEVNF